MTELKNKMRGKSKVVEIMKEAFARSVVENGGNATKAVQVIKPQLSNESAGVAASRLLNEDKVLQDIAGYSQSVMDMLQVTLKKAIALTDKWLDEPDGNDVCTCNNQAKIHSCTLYAKLSKQQKALAWLSDITKSLAPAQRPPTQHKHIHIPK